MLVDVVADDVVVLLVVGIVVVATVVVGGAGVGQIVLEDSLCTQRLSCVAQVPAVHLHRPCSSTVGPRHASQVADRFVT